MINLLEQIVDGYPDETFWKADGLDEAVIGVDSATNRLIYSMDKIISVLKEDMTEGEAIEYMDFNILDAHITDPSGEEVTPIWCRDM